MFRRVALCSLLFMICLVAAVSPAAAQGGQTLFGDVKIDSNETDRENGQRNIVVILYRDGAGEVGRQSVANRSRYRFINLVKGEYQLVVEVDNNEIGRIRIVIRELSDTPYGFQQDLLFSLKRPANKTGVVSAADVYDRSSANRDLFRKAHEAVEKKNYDEAAKCLTRIVESDKLDFQAWTLLGTVHFVQANFVEAEKAYLAALEAKPAYPQALIDLGKLRLSQKNYEGALEPLRAAVAAKPDSAEANLLLGQLYVNLKQGSKAVPYLNEAVNLGRPEAHLLLGWLYDAAGMKDKAALEYETFLKKVPTYADRNKLQEYVKSNKR